MWDDPLFNPGAETAKKYLEDTEFIEFRRQERLHALELLYIKIAALEGSRRKWKEAVGRNVWVLTELLARADIPRAVLEAVNIEQQVNMMDPDFSFAEWLKNHSDQQERLKQAG